MEVPLLATDFLNRAVKLFPTKEAVVDGDRRFTYAEFDARSNQLAHALAGLGIGKGDRVSIISPNSHQYLEAFYATAALGAVIVPINYRLIAADFEYINNHAGAKICLADSDYTDAVDSIRGGLENVEHYVVVPYDGAAVPDGWTDYEALIAGRPTTRPPAPSLGENDLLSINYTSGTTARPKGVMITHRNVYIHTYNVIIHLKITQDDRQMWTLPMFHVNGWGTPQGITAVGGRHVMLRKFDAAEVLRLIETERVTRFFAVPTMLSMLLNHPDVTSHDLSSLELINTGGAPTPPEMIRQAEQVLGCCVAGGYGLTETSPIVTFAADKSYLADQDEATRLRRRASTGLPVVGAEIAIVDMDGNPLDWDGQSVGEIVVRSNAVTTGYYKDPQATDKATSDGWFHTGDLATIDEEGYVLIVDRKKDLIISGGENISSVEIEKVLFEHPAVLECAVVSAPDERWGEVPVAVVALAQGGNASAKELQDFCRERLAGFKVPKQVDFMDSLPKGGTGKIIKRQLREPYWKGRTKRVH